MLLTEAIRIAKGRFGAQAGVEVGREGKKYVAKLKTDKTFTLKTTTATTQEQALNLLFR